MFVVFTEPHAGRDGTYNDWYNNQHLSDVLKVPGITAAQRFQHIEKQRGEEPLRRYLALYDIETDDLSGTYNELISRADTDEMPLSPAFDRTKSIAHLFEPITRKVSAGSEQ